MTLLAMAETRSNTRREKNQVTCRAHLLLWGEKSKPFVMTGGRNEMKQAQVDFLRGFSDCLTSPKKSDIEPRSPICEACRNAFYVLGEENRALLATGSEDLQRVEQGGRMGSERADEGEMRVSAARLIIYLRELMHVESQCQRVMQTASGNTMGSEVLRVLRSCHNTLEELSLRFSIIVSHIMVANRVTQVGQTLQYNQQCLSCRMEAVR
ncbi:hypothetical protein GUITHDRAFT_149055 [Guillardia theta CCMP2712]|uniref:Uncharacterized protein n=1 Tax=Guillardia theta (strain CCMP2712) TaxID=905079 RepID=L1I6X3_GUITC|nr:hypothetical protein GUITHDRAFT_149055 [Guillardia theta CCMP2712]EKX31802.1 hypothetical protein GUITHDRAFT_149055 [Guillardia theta CCMP2712]|eukprot:XP_005818782.1 hypothetical protein GUITHDRAFT_149055 [Guillardia theta CCMP2712]